MLPMIRAHLAGWLLIGNATLLLTTALALLDLLLAGTLLPLLLL